MFFNLNKYNNETPSKIKDINQIGETMTYFISIWLSFYILLWKH